MSLHRFPSRMRAAFILLAIGIVFAASFASADAAPPEGGVAAAATNPPASGLNLPFSTHLGPIVKDNPQTVDVTADKFGAGIFAVLPAGAFCNEACSTLTLGVVPGTPISVAAQPSSGWEIRAWTGCTPAADNKSCDTTAAEGTRIHVSFGQINTVFAAPLRLLTATSTSSMQITGDVYTFPQNSETGAILPGDFIASVEGSGFLKKAVSVDRHDAVADVTTAPASLLDVISEGTLTLGLSSLLGGGGAPASNTFNISIPIDETFGSAHVSGNLSAGGSLVAEVNVSQGQITGMHVGFAISANGTINASADAVDSPSIPVDDVQGGCFTALFIPVCVDIKLAAQVAVDSAGHIDIGGTVAFSANGDLTFDSAGFHVNGTTSKDLKISAPVDHVKGNVSLTLEPTIGLTILGKPAADIAIPVTMSARMDPALVPWLRASATVDGNANVHAGGLFLPDNELGPFSLFSINEEFYRSPTVGLTVIKSGEGSIAGSDQFHAANISCSTDQTTCSAVYNAPIGSTVDMVKLTATPSPGWVLVGWSGGCTPAGSPTCTVPMDKTRTVTVIFTHSGQGP